MRSEVGRANWKDRVLYFLGRRKAFLVEGDSMLPMLKSGDCVLIDPKSPISPGDIVLAEHPYKKGLKLIKRIDSVDSDGGCLLIGTNPDESSDSRTLGRFLRASIKGKVVCRL
ncbi:MAG: S26 family signal peptidase [Pyrinomonadaceae bacterium]